MKQINPRIYRCFEVSRYISWPVITVRKDGIQTPFRPHQEHSDSLHRHHNPSLTHAHTHFIMTKFVTAWNTELTVSKLIKKFLTSNECVGSSPRAQQPSPHWSIQPQLKPSHHMYCCQLLSEFGDLGKATLAS